MYTKTYHYIYIIVNFKKNMLYVGKHSTSNIEDGYFGSGTMLKSQIQYGVDNFYRFIIDFTSEQYLNDLEKFYIAYFQNNFNGILLNQYIPQSVVKDMPPFWSRSYSFLWMLKDETDPFAFAEKRPLLLGTHFIKGLKELEYYNYQYEPYVWALGQAVSISLGEKIDEKTNVVIQYIQFKAEVNNRHVYGCTKDLGISETKYYIYPVNTKFSIKNFAGYFKKEQD